ncbi:MAG TPA: S8 family serine peptidase [Desulfatiglandales bacterium]|nr:S8 family serine peptidase [Desulfatiglandales bacterium]
MKKPALWLSVAFLVLISPLWAVASAGELKPSKPRGPAYVPGELLVKYRPSMGAAVAGYYRTHWGISNIRTFKSTGVQHVKLPEDMTVEEALEVFRTDPDVVYAEPNYYVHATETPDDTFFSRLWALHNTGQFVNGMNGTLDADIDAPEAWEITTGSTEVIIAVVDSGVDYNHPDLEAHIWINPGEIPGDGEDNDNNLLKDDVRGWDFVDIDNDPMDSDDHGTHVAGTIAAIGNNSLGVTGVCWTAKIMALRFLDAFGDGTTDKAISAIEYANDKGAHVINNSWGGGGYSQALKEAIDASSALVVCAAGNTGTNIDIAPFYPASFTTPHIISVAATDQNDNRSIWTPYASSNYGISSVDVAAPGTNIYSCRPAREDVWSDDFEGAFDWTTDGTNNFWGLTEEASRSSSHSLTDRPDADYLPGTESYAQTPAIDLSSKSGAVLTFWFKGTSLSGDYFYVQASNNGVNFDELILVIDDQEGIYWTGSQSTFALATADLGAYDGSSTLYLRFNFYSNADGTVEEGWFFDDVTITAASSTYNGTEYQFLQGTSMAAPHVSGIAGLIKAFNPSLTHTEIKLAIESSVDPKASLNGLVATGGRVNAYNAITPCSAPGNLSAGAASAYRINLGWTDNAHNEMGFRIERKDSPTGIYSQIATVSPNATSYSDTGVSPSTTYSYRIRAYNAAGNSGYSNEDDATTPAAPPPSDSGNSICFIATAGHGSFVADHFIRGVIPALVILLLGMAGIGLGITGKRRRT